MIARPQALVAGLAALALMASACRLPNIKDYEQNASPLAQTSFLYDSRGGVITEFHAGVDRQPVSINKIPEDVRNAVIAVEDRRYYEHRGVDIKAVMRAAYVNATQGAIVQGGSTITEQYVKNAFLTPEQTFSRKFNEAVLAWQLEQQFTKDDILAKYLNTVYFGEGAYGIKAAANAYYSRPPEDLNLPQAAMLAGLIAAPVTFDPLNHKKKKITVERRNTVLELMEQQHMITRDQFMKSSREPLNLHPATQKVETYPSPYFVDYFKRWFLSNPKFGETYEERYDMLFNGGLRIYTAMDPKIQADADKAVNGVLSQNSDPYGALTALDPRTGDIVAMVGGRDYFSRNDKFSKVNLATGGSTGRQSGSSFKPYVLVAALEKGFSPNKTYNAPGCINIHIKDSTKPWHVCNAEPSSFGRISIRDATINSVNTVYAQIIMDVGPAKAVKVAEEMGIRCCIRATQPQTPLSGVPSAVLGTNEVNTLEMASAFGTLATGGLHVNPTPVVKITDSDGNLVYAPDHKLKQVVPEGIANKAEQILEGVVQSGTGTAANIGRPQIGKTGTNQNYSDAWFLGAVPQLSAAVWVGFPQGQKSMGSTRIGPVFGGTWPAQIWHNFMARATNGLPRENFPRNGLDLVSVEVDTTRGCLPNKYTPPGIIEKQQFVKGTEPRKHCTEPTSFQSIEVPSVIGLGADRAKKDLAEQGFAVDVVEKHSGQPKGSVISQFPAGGQSLQTNKSVTITISKGA